jgi:hypothetical protein
MGIKRAARLIAASAGLVCALAGLASPAHACNRGREACSFTLVNKTGHALRSFWASPARASKWEEDILGRRTLPSGDEINVNMTDKRPDCIYDFRFRFADGDELVRKAINVCRLSRYTLND